MKELQKLTVERLLAKPSIIAFNKGEIMKRLTIALLAVMFLATGAWAMDKATVSANVDAIVAAIDGGKDATTFTADAVEPYVFIMEESGMLLVHPTLAGENLMEKAPPAFEALKVATPEGTWVQYEWNGKTKNTYAKKTKNNLIVGSGF